MGRAMAPESMRIAAVATINMFELAPQTCPGQVTEMMIGVMMMAATVWDMKLPKNQVSAANAAMTTQSG